MYTFFIAPNEYSKKFVAFLIDLSPKYRIKIISGKIVDEEDEASVLKGSECSIPDDDKNVILHPVSSMPLGCLDSTIPDSLKVDFLILKKICMVYENRDKGDTK
jgi:hypothetical protein